MTKYMRVRLTEGIERAIPIEGVTNEWPADTEFYVRQENPGEGMPVVLGPHAGVGVPHDTVEVLDEFEKFVNAAAHYVVAKATGDWEE